MKLYASTLFGYRRRDDKYPEHIRRKLRLSDLTASRGRKSFIVWKEKPIMKADVKWSSAFYDECYRE
jgi:hypothetical protein